MISEVEDIVTLLENEIPLGKFLEGADGMAEYRIQREVAARLRQLGYLLVNEADLEQDSGAQDMLKSKS